MPVRQRRYKLLADFAAVHRFLGEIYSLKTLNSYLLPQFYEYAHTHPAFNHKLTHRFGLWEEDGKLVGVTCFEMDIGECFLAATEDHKGLLPEMLDDAEEELSVMADSGKSLSVWVTDNEIEKRELLIARGYTKVYFEPVRIFDYKNPFGDYRLPAGYTIISLEEENDFKKINDCLWKGFDHGDDPDDDLDCRRLMQSGPNFRKDLTTVIKAPDGDYACFAGMFFDEDNRYAYLEPLATVPRHRGKGLAAAALTEGMKKTKALGADYCFGGSNDFYTAMGFETICHRELFKKEWDGSRGE